MNAALRHRPLPARARFLRASCSPSFIRRAASSQSGALALRAIGLTVFDLERTERFYGDTLDFRTVARRRLEDSFLNALLRPAGQASGCAGDAAR